MPILNMLTFFAIFIFIVLMTGFIFLTLYNRKTKSAIDKFIIQVNELKPSKFENIKLRYWTTSGQRSRISINNYCDLYLFDNCLSIVRRQDFIFKVFFSPVLITADIANTKYNFNYLDAFKPDQINFNKIMNGEVDITLKDPIYKHYKIDITFKGLTNEQINQLEKIKSWC